MAQPVPIWIEDDPEASPGGHSALTELADRFLSEVNASGIAIAHEHEGKMVCVASAGHTAPPIGAVVDVNSGITGRCLREFRPLHCYDTDIDPRVEKEACRRLGIRSLAITPFTSDSGATGFVEVFSDRPGAFDPTHLAALQTLIGEILEVLNEKKKVEAESTSEATSSAREEEALPEALTESEERRDAWSYSTTDYGDRTGKHGARSGGIGRTVAWASLILAGSVAALSLPRLVHHRQEQPAAVTLSAESSVPGQSLSIRPASAIEVQKPASTSLQEISQRARAGDLDAQYQLANNYASGEGVQKDPVKAAVWYIISGNSGNQPAKDAAVQITRQLRPFEIAQVRFNVGKMFADGIGTQKDPVSAYLWFALAEAAGDVRAKTEEGKLAESMTVSEINDAQTRASTWLSGHKHQTTAALHGGK